MAELKSLRAFNDYYGLSKDELLGWVLVPKDSYTNGRLKYGQTIKMVVVFKENYVGFGADFFHWVAIAASELTQEGGEYIWKLDGLPRFLDDLASKRYVTRAQAIAGRAALRNPLLAEFIAPEGATSSEEMLKLEKEMLRESRFGERFGFTKEYDQDINGRKIKLTGLVVYVNEKVALFYNKKFQIGIVRSIDFDSPQTFKEVCQLGKWISGTFTRPFLAKQFKLQYNLMPDKDHQIGQIEAPEGVETRIRHFRGYYQFDPPEQVVQVKVQCHFVPENLKRTRRSVLHGHGLFVQTNFGRVYMDFSFYADGNFSRKHLALWVSCLPRYLHFTADLDAFWHYCGSLTDDPYGPGHEPSEEDDVPTERREDEKIYTNIGMSLRSGVDAQKKTRVRPLLHTTPGPSAPVLKVIPHQSTEDAEEKKHSKKKYDDC